MGFGTNPQYGFERPVVIQMEMLGRQLVCKPGVSGEQGVGGVGGSVLEIIIWESNIKDL